MNDALVWNYNEFIAFLLIHVSYADLEFTIEEKDAIKELVPEKQFEKLHEEYLEKGDYEILQTILSYKGVFYPTTDRKNEIIHFVKEQSFVDGEFTRLEKSLINFLDKLM